MENFEKVVRIGMSKDWDGKPFSTYCKINFVDGNLSISGVEGPTRDGNAQGFCGQIIAHDWDFTEYAPGWDSDKVARFREVWKRWHLNSMRVGCEHQREIDTTRTEHTDGMLGKVCGVCGHRYGSSWLKVEVPEEVLTFLKGLPDTDRTPAWV